MIYSLEQIKDLLVPIAIKYNLKGLWIFGSYARGEATDKSDIDIIIDYTESKIHTFIDFAAIGNDFEEVTNKSVDLISTNSLFSQKMQQDDPKFVNKVSKEMIVIYDI
ncbi:MAG: nucleotidyltransferase domain-containing protein [Deltaproteobacteria bacterium]|jgi:predicted nucleotidyltransferase|nr:nucleotidyltransferase domain-containing protein [Deltaproteobacteria bacterium]